MYRKQKFLKNIYIAPWRLKTQRRLENRELNQARSKPDTECKRNVQKCRTYRGNRSAECSISVWLADCDEGFLYDSNALLRDSLCPLHIHSSGVLWHLPKSVPYINLLTYLKDDYFLMIIITEIISKTMFMVLSSWQSHWESSPGSFDECRTAPSGCRPKTKPDDLGCESACTGCQKLHPLSPFIIFTQPESWYSFYRPTEGRSLSILYQQQNSSHTIYHLNFIHLDHISLICKKLKCTRWQDDTV